MEDTKVIARVYDKKAARKDKRRKFLRLMFGRKIVVIAAVVVLIFILTSIFAGIISPYDPDEASLYESNQPPSAAHLLGTDNLGRDTLSRLFYGGRVSILVGVFATFVAAAVGVVLGMTAAFFGGWVDVIIMRLCESIMAIPSIVLSMSLITIFGSGLVNMAVILGVSCVPLFVRMMRAETLSVKPVSYTHLDVYKRQTINWMLYNPIIPIPRPNFFV